MKKVSCPGRGELGWLLMNPQLGREQAGRRPVICISPSSYNVKTSLAVFCPITSKTKGYPFEVSITSAGLTGVVLADQIKSLDWGHRQFTSLGTASSEELEAVIAKTIKLIQV